MHALRIPAVACLFAFGAVAGAADHCGEVLQRTGRNFSNEQYFNAVASRLYDQTCNGSTVRNNAGGSLSVDTIIEELPIRFGASGNSSSEKVQNFCRTYDSLVKNNSADIKVTSTVVDNSVNAWLHCQQLAGAGVDFTPAIQRTQFSVTVTRTGAAPVSIMGVQYDPKKASCTLPDKGILGARAVTADMNTRVALKDADTTLTVSCSRLPVQLAGGALEYPDIDFQINTDKTVAFSLPVQADAQMPVGWASTIQQQIADVKTQAATTQSALRKLTAGAGQCSPGGFVSKFPAEPATAAMQCPVGTYARGVEFRHASGHDLAYQEDVQVWCCPIGG